MEAENAPAFDDGAAREELVGFSIDSRSIRAGELFFALSPEDYRRHKFTAKDFADAHDFIPQAFEQGAAFIVARRERVSNDEQLIKYRERLLLVDDVIAALQFLARGVVERWGKPVVGITGSAGKTTTKDLTAHILTLAGKRIVSTQKNYNNELGVPLSILQMETDGNHAADFDAAVLEMGMSLPGEIAELCKIARPRIGVELIVAPVHLEFVGSIEAIAKGKSDLVKAVPREGVSILNADDKWVIGMRAQCVSRVMTYGVVNPADVTASEIDAGELGSIAFTLHTPRGNSKTRLPLSGRHNLTNALAAASVAHEFGLSPDDIAEALRSARPSAMRGEVTRLTITGTGETQQADASFAVIDDSYNSNPRSLHAMTSMLSEVTRLRDKAGISFEIKPDARRLVVAGEMLELGSESSTLHYQAGREIAEIGNINILLGVRGQAQHIVEGARAAGMSEGDARFCLNTDEAANELLKLVRVGDVILIKGSRGVGLDQAVRRLLEGFAPAT